MDYKKPSKAKANDAFLRKSGYDIGNPYAEEKIDHNKTFLIICEGQNTEPLYFAAFPVASSQVKIIGGCNSKMSLVDFALKLKDDPVYAGREVWCVFDYDVAPGQSNQANDFNSAIQKAIHHGMKCAWSNDAFELWFVLHYKKLVTPLSRHELYPILEKDWAINNFDKFAKTTAFCQGHYERHGGSKSPSRELAIRRAKELHERYAGLTDFAKQCPCTTVYLLVEELNKYVKH